MEGDNKLSLREEVDEFFESYNVMCELTGQKTIFVGENGEDIVLSCVGFLCYITVTKKNIKLNIKVFSHFNRYDYSCKKLEDYLKIKASNKQGGLMHRVFKTEFKSSLIEQFKIFMRDCIFDIFEEGER